MRQDRGARHERRALRDTGAVDGVARGEVVGAIEHHVGLGDQLQQLRFVNARRQGGVFDLGVDLAQRRLRGQHLGFPDRARTVHDLALQVAEVDRVVVAQGKVTDAARRQIQRGRRSESAESDDQRMARQQPFLAFDSDVIEQDMAAIAQELLIVHRRTVTPFG